MPYTNLEEKRAYDRGWHQRARAQDPSYLIANNHRISRDQVRAALAIKPDTCEICQRPESQVGMLRFDHCHHAKRFRGWLCANCNTGIGMFEENIEYLEAAILYVQTKCISV